MAESTKTFSASLSSTIPRNCRNKRIKGKTKTCTSTGNSKRSVYHMADNLSHFFFMWCMWEQMNEFHDR